MFVKYCVPVLLAAGSLPQLNAQQQLRLRIDHDKKFQTIENIGASGCWFSEGLGTTWPAAEREKAAKLLFSRKFGPDGQPTGIGLSAWRFNIGGGTAEQGSGSGIKTSVKRVESFLDSTGKYDFTKQAGYQWFLRKAKEYGVEYLIAFSNTPPVFFNKNGLGFKTEKDYVANLRPDKYVAYADFLATVVDHFNKQGLHFSFLSPVNEPQWDWSNKFGEMNQEGTPWHNEDIYRITEKLDSILIKRRINTRVIVPEAATLKYLYNERGHASRQIQHFFNPSSPFNVRKFKSVYPVAVGHSYFTDAGDSARVAVRVRLKDTAAAYGVPFWQSEYSMLGNGYKENKKGRIPAIDCALFLAKMIHTDLTVADAAAWQLWNVYEPGSAEFDTRYYLIALNTDDSNSTGTITVTKNLWAMGHFSLFVRPGMQRIDAKVHGDDPGIHKQDGLMISAFSGKDGKKVVVLINYSDTAINLDARELSESYRSSILYTTTADNDVNMKPGKLKNLQNVSIPARSVNTIVVHERK